MRPTLETAWRELLAHPWRTLAVASGLSLGAAATVASGALAASVERGVLADADAQGRGLLVLAVGSERSGVARASLVPAGISVADVEALRSEIAGIERLAPSSSTLALVAAGPNQTRRTLVLGTTPDYFAITEQALERGRWMTAEELAAGAPVCVAGPALAAQLLGAADPLQSSVRVGTLSCAIVGVLAAKGPNAASDDLLAMPLLTLQRSVTGVSSISAVYLSVRPEHSPLVVAHQVDSLMRERRRLAPGAVAELSVRGARAFVPGPPGAAEHVPSALAGAAIAGYLLGGMHILLGLRSSSDERRRRQELEDATANAPLRVTLEAALLSALAGLLGAIVGLVLSYVTARLGGYPFSVPSRSVPVAVALSLLVGMTFALPAVISAARRSSPEPAATPEPAAPPVPPAQA
jgi:putative ABC transport system permease protein